MVWNEDRLPGPGTLRGLFRLRPLESLFLALFYQYWRRVGDDPLDRRSASFFKLRRLLEPHFFYGDRVVDEYSYEAIYVLGVYFLEERFNCIAGNVPDELAFRLAVLK